MIAVLATARLAELVREGNAARPSFAPLTTDAHVQTIFNRLDLDRRQQVAQWVARSRPS